MKIQDQTVTVALRAMYNYGCQLEGRTPDEAEFVASLAAPDMVEVTAALRVGIEAALDDVLATGQVLNG